MEGFKVAATQLDTRYQSLEHNIDAHLRLMAEAAGDGCQLVVFPELSATGHNGSPEIVQFAEPADGPIFQAIHEEARDLDIIVGYGFAELFRGTHYNSYSLVGPDGLIGTQRKIHASHDEFFRFRQAYEWHVFDLGFCKAGISICRDGDLWETWRILGVMGAEVVLLPHAIRKMIAPDGGLSFDGAEYHATDAELLEVQRQMYEERPNPKLHDVMAKTNGLYAVFSDHVGFDGHSSHVGCAYVINPEGRLIAQAKPAVSDAWVSAVLDPEIFYYVRRSPWFHLKTRRPETYGELVRQL